MREECIVNSLMSISLQQIRSAPSSPAPLPQQTEGERSQSGLAFVGSR